MIQTPDWLRVALDEYELDVREIPGVENNERVVLYHQSTSLKATNDEIAWCSSLACHCLETAGIRSTRSAAARSWLYWGAHIAPPAYGAIVILKRGSGAGSHPADPNPPKPGDGYPPGHVCFLLYATDFEVTVLGGNQSNRICIESYPRDRVIGMRWALI